MFATLIVHANEAFICVVNADNFGLLITNKETNKEEKRRPSSCVAIFIFLLYALH